MFKNGRGLEIGHEEIGERLRQGVLGLDELRGDELAGLEKAEAAKVSGLQRERKRLRTKLGADHPRVLGFDDRIRQHRQAMGEARAVVDQVQTAPPATKSGSWLLYGYARTVTGKPLAEVTVGLVLTQPDTVQEPVATARTDAGGYFELRYILETAEEDGPGGGDNDDDTEPAGEQKRGQQEEGSVESDYGEDDVVPQQVAVSRHVYPYVQGRDGERHFGDRQPFYTRSNGRNFTVFLLDEVESGSDPGRFVGNANTRELHDLETKGDKGHIDTIRWDHRVSFNSVEEAQRRGYDFCAYCFGRDKSKR